MDLSRSATDAGDQRRLFVKENPELEYFAPSLRIRNAVEFDTDVQQIFITDDAPSNPSVPAIVRTLFAIGTLW